MGPPLASAEKAHFQSVAVMQPYFDGYGLEDGIGIKSQCLHSDSFMPTSSSATSEISSSITNMVSNLEGNDYKRFRNSQSEYDNPYVDPVYRMFFEHLREDGKSYVFEMSNGDHGLPIFLKYEGEDGLSNEIESENQISSRSYSVKGRKDSVSNRKQTSGSSKSPQTIGPLAPNSQFEMDCSLLDESYQIFLSHLKFQGDSMVLEYESGVSVTYEEERAMPTASERLASEDTVNSGEQGLVPFISSQPSDLTAYEDDSRPIPSPHSSDSSGFKEKLMAAISKPYDQTEYEELLKEATNRKPLNRQKHLRSMSISYATKQIGLSYLDHHPDLARQIESADCYRGLTLLRGFFFWLKNLCHEGAFMPWVLPALSYEAIATSGYDLLLPIDIARDEN